MDKRISLSVHFTRLVADGATNQKKIHGWDCQSIDRATKSMDEGFDPSIAPPL